MRTKSDQASLSLVKPDPNVIFRRLGDEIVLFHLGSDRFYELNLTAARFWELLNSENDLGHTRQRLLEEFDVEPDQLTNETEALLNSLLRENLISVNE